MTTETDSRPRRTRRKRIRLSDVVAQWPLLILLAGVLVTLGFVMVDRWRRAALLLAVVAFVAAAMRAVLPDSTTGLVRVRGRGFDVAFLLALGGGILWLALSIDALGTGA